MKKKKTVNGKELGSICTKALDEIVAGKKNPSECPACSSRNTLFRKTDKIRWCRKCGAEWSIDIKTKK